jgi:hypothetical protein
MVAPEDLLDTLKAMQQDITSAKNSALVLDL